MPRQDESLLLRVGDERLELLDGRCHPTELGLPPHEAVEQLERAWARAPLEVMQALSWPPFERMLRHRAGPMLDAMLDLVRWGDILVIGPRRVARGARLPRPIPAPPGRRPPPVRPDRDDLVNPVIGLPVAVLLVGKDYLEKPARTPVRLSTDRSFDGEARFSCSSNKLRFFLDARGDDPFDPSEVLALGAGIVIFAEALSPSAANEDIELRLHLIGGSKQRGPDDVVNVTAVELTLDIFSDPRGRGGERMHEGATKVKPGRFIPLADATWHNDEAYALDKHDVLTDNVGHPHARLVVRQTAPSSFAGRLVLRRAGTSATLFEGEDSRALPLELDNAERELLVEGTALGSQRFELGVVGLVGIGDAVHIEVVSAIFSRSDNTAFGYDDMDGELFRLHHVSILSGGSTHVRLELGGNFTDGLFVVSDAAAIAAPKADALAGDMDLEIAGAPGHFMAETLLAVRLGSPDGPAIAALGVHVYEEMRFRIGIIRIHDPLSPLTGEAGNLLPLHDVGLLEQRANELLRLLFVRITLVRGQPELVPIRYDLNGDGVLRIDFAPTEASEPMPEQDLLGKVLQPLVAFDYLIGIVADVDYRVELGAPAKKGATELVMHPALGARSVAFLTSQPTQTLVSATHRETIAVTTTNSANVANLSGPIGHDYDAGDFVLVDAGGLSTPTGILDQRDEDGNPAASDFMAAKIAHEIGHALCDLRDVKVSGNLMFNRSPFNTPVRYKRLPARYSPDDVDPPLQRQWDAPRLAKLPNA